MSSQIKLISLGRIKPNFMNKRVQSAVSWSGIDLAFRQIAGLAIIVILARILSPSDFGLMAMAAVFISIGMLFANAGFSQTLIHRQDVTHEDESTVFFFNIFLSIVMATILWALSAYIASYLEHPALEDILIVLAINMIISSFGAIHYTLLNKHLAFDVIAKVGMGSTVISGLIAIWAAYFGLGVWSLVIQAVCASVVTLVLLWFMHDWRPSFVFQVQTIRTYFSYGSYITFAALLYTIQQHVHAIVIGKYYSAANAGAYSRSYSLMQMPVILLSGVISRVVFPVFSQRKDDRGKLKQMLEKALVMTMFVTLPVTVFMCVMAKLIILVVLGGQWLEAVPILQVLSVSAALIPIQMLNINILKAMGHADINAKLMVVKFIIAMSLLYLAIPYGIVVIAWAFVGSHVFNIFLNTYYSHVFLDYGLMKQIKVISPYILPNIALAVVLFGLLNVFKLGGLGCLLVLLPLGVLVYLVTAWVLKLKAFDIMLGFIKKKRY